MSQRTPLVAAGALFDPATPLSPIRLDTPAWLAWLEQPTTTRFAYPLFDPTRGYIVGRMTVRKERRQRGGSYWTVCQCSCDIARGLFILIDHPQPAPGRSGSGRII